MIIGCGIGDGEGVKVIGARLGFGGGVFVGGGFVGVALGRWVDVKVALGSGVAEAGEIASVGVAVFVALIGDVEQLITPPKLRLKSNTVPSRNRVAKYLCILQDNLWLSLGFAHGVESCDGYF